MSGSEDKSLRNNVATAATTNSSTQSFSPVINTTTSTSTSTTTVSTQATLIMTTVRAIPERLVEPFDKDEVKWNN